MAIQMDSVARIRPRPSSEIAASPWGVNFSSPQAEDWTPVMERTAELGCKWVRTHCSWGKVEATRGVYDWSEPDQTIDFFTSHSVEPYVNIGLSNPAYQGATHGVAAHGVAARGIPPQRDPEALAAWKAFLRAAAERYRDRVTYWEMANEPNIRIFWQPEPDAVEYARFVIEGAQVLKEVNPDCKICAGVTAGIPMDYIREFLAAGTVPYFDVFVYHAYRTVPEGYSNRLVVRAQTDVNQVKLTLDKNQIAGLDFLAEYAELEKWLRRRGFQGPIWQGETGYPSSEDTIHWRGDGPWGPTIQAKFVLRRLLIDWFAGADMSAYFLMLEFSSILNPNLAWGFHAQGKNTKGLLVLEDLSPKPAYFALQRLCSALAEVQRCEQAAYRVAVTDTGSLPAATSARDLLAWTYAYPSGKRAFVYWLPKGMSEHVQPGALDLGVALAWDEPVLVDLIADAVTPLAPSSEDGWTRLEGLPLTDYPLIVAEKGDLPLR
jgi:hypothetical protein